MYISGATEESNMEVSQKTQSRNTTGPRNFTTGYTSEENKNTNSKRYLHIPITFIAALFITDKLWKQPKFSSTGE